MQSVPLIDMEPYLSGKDKAGVARRVDLACREIGFLLIKNHGVANSLIEQTERVSNAFFSLAFDEKMRAARPSPEILRGYVPVASESLAKTLGVAGEGDLNESFMIGDPRPNSDSYYSRQEARSYFAPNIWPDNPPEFRKIWTDYFDAMTKLSMDIMRVFALALSLPENYFDGKIDRHTGRVRVRSYPPIAREVSSSQTRAGAHTDYGSLTILKPQTGAGGLQVFTKTGEWIDVPDVEGTFVINIGDLMARWTNDNWVSTLHRVVVPEGQARRESRRQSVVFFHNPNYDAMVSCIPTCAGPDNPEKYEPIQAGDYLFGKYMLAQLS